MQQIFSPELLRENLKIPWKSQGKLREFSLSKCAPLKKDGVSASPPYQGKPCPLGFSCAVSKQFDAGRQNVQT